MENPWKALVNGGVNEKIWYKMLRVHMVIMVDLPIPRLITSHCQLPASTQIGSWIADLRRLTPFGRSDLSPPKHWFRSWYCCINIAGKPRFSGTAAGKPQFSLKCTKLSVFVLDWFFMALLAANWAADPPVSSLRHRIWTQWMETVTHMFDCILPTIERKCIW